MSKNKPNTAQLAQEHLERALEEFKQATTLLKGLAHAYAMRLEAADAPAPAKKAPKPKAPAKPAKAEKPAAPEKPAEAPAVTRHRTPASVRLTPHEITLNLGSFPVKALAEADAKDFLNNPSVFWYRATQFPDPRRYQVQPRVEGAKVVKRADPKFARAPWTVSVTIAVIGEDKKCDAWGTGVLSRNRGDQE